MSANHVCANRVCVDISVFICGEFVMEMNLQKQITTIMEGMNGYAEYFLQLSARINTLESSVENLVLGHRNLWKRVGELSAECENRRPWMCPVCEGKGKIYINPAAPMSGIEAAFAPRDINGMQYNECHACEKGVLWR